jgi:hypothetical protein
MRSTLTFLVAFNRIQLVFEIGIMALEVAPSHSVVVFLAKQVWKFSSITAQFCKRVKQFAKSASKTV